MDISYEIKDGSLVFKDLSVGNLLNGELLSWDELRRILIVQTRFGTCRPIEARTLEELQKETEGVTNEVNSWRSRAVEEEKLLKQHINNQGAIIESLEDTVGRQNREINEFRKLSK